MLIFRNKPVIPEGLYLESMIRAVKAELSSLPAQTKLMPFGYKNWILDQKRFVNDIFSVQRKINANQDS